MNCKTGQRVLALAALVAVWAGGCSDRTEAKPSAEPGSNGTERTSARPAAQNRSRDALLELAFDTATAVPLEPHRKDRARAQERVVLACLELGLSDKARAYADRIGNWRRGTAYGDLAVYYAEASRADEAQTCREEAKRVAEAWKGWRRDRILVKVARAHALLGSGPEAKQVAAAVTEDSETGKLAGLAEGLEDVAAFQDRLRTLRERISSENFDLTRNTLQACVELYGAFYEDTSRREALEAIVRDTIDSLPIHVRIDLLEAMAGKALAHDDRPTAQRLAEQANEIMAAATWRHRFGLPLRARLGELRYLAGNREAGRAQVDAALGEYRAEWKRITNIDRAGILRRIAEAYRAMGDAAAAGETYRMAVEAGVANPNSRPRAEDLTATCVSMALHGVTPDAALWARMREIRRNLGRPW